MKAVIYARYSSDLQSAASIDDQIRQCKERIDREGWSLVFSYSDRAISGANHLRPGYQKLLEDARAGLFDVVVAEALDRLSRDQEHIAGFFKQLTFAGIKIITLAEGEISELHVGLKGTMNALFLKDLADKTRRGMRGRVEEGMAASGKCYGYDIVREFDASSAPVRGKRKINDSEAAVLRRIFEEYANGKSPIAIAKSLNAENIPGPTSKGWAPSTIHGHRQRCTGILNNELYIGKMVWNRMKFSKDPQTGKHISKLNPQSAWITKEVPELRIIDQDLWNRVKDHQIATELPERGRKISNVLNTRHRPQHLFSGLMKCGVCGGNYTVYNQDRYACSNHIYRGTCGNTHSVNREDIESRLLTGIKDRLVTPELIAVFVKEFNEQWNRTLAANNHNKAIYETELGSIKKRLDQIMDAIEQGIITPTTKDRLLALEARQDEVRMLMAKANVEPEAPALHPNLAEMYKRKIADLEAALNDPSTKTEAAQLLRGLVDAIVIHPGQKRGDVSIELYGELAALMQIDNIKRKTRTSDDVRVSLDAGARFELTTFRL